jgi:hypothetical protein
MVCRINERDKHDRSLLMRWHANPSPVIRLVSPVTNGTIILSMRQIWMNARLFSGFRAIWPRAGVRSHGMLHGRPGQAGQVVWCFQVVKAAQSRGCAGRPLLYNNFPAPSRAAGMLRNGVVRRCHISVCYTQVIRWARADHFLVVGGRCTGRARRCKATQGRRRETALRCEYLTPQ